MNGTVLLAPSTRACCSGKEVGTLCPLPVERQIPSGNEIFNSLVYLLLLTSLPPLWQPQQLKSLLVGSARRRPGENASSPSVLECIWRLSWGSSHNSHAWMIVCAAKQAKSLPDRTGPPVSLLPYKGYLEIKLSSNGCLSILFSGSHPHISAGTWSGAGCW